MSANPRSGQLLELAIGDDSVAWRNAGFSVTDDAADIGGITLRFVGRAGTRGILGWRLHGIDESIDGLPIAGPGYPPVPTTHPNRVVGLDHVVAGSPDLDRTTAALEARGIDLRHIRDFERDGVARQQRFFWLGSVILELIGRAHPKPDASGPATFWGLAFTTDDIDATCRVLGGRTSEHRAAIQSGRRISTLRGETLGISLPVAFMTPHGVEYG